MNFVDLSSAKLQRDAILYGYDETSLKAVRNETDNK